MNHLRTVDNKVMEILKECPETRFDDMQLILCYYNRFGQMRLGEFSLEDIVNNYKGYGLPCFETIRRARQRVQALFPELSRQCCGCCCDCEMADCSIAACETTDGSDELNIVIEVR